MRLYRTKLQEKLKEALEAVLPIIGIVLVLCFTIAPVSPGILLAFLAGAVLLIIGMMFFTLGVELSMTPMGERVGTCMTKSKNLAVMVFLGFVMGFIITVSEPDLQVLAGQVPSIPNMALILAVAGGVGMFLVVALLRMLFAVPLPPMLLVFYGAAFVLALFVPKDFLAVAFDSGGVTTGPMTVPFIMALGVGISAIRSDKHASDDSFGLVALCSIGPILSVLVLGLIYHPQGGAYEPPTMPDIDTSVELWDLFAHGFPTYMKEMALSILPIILFFGIFLLIFKGLSQRKLIRIGIGLVYTYVGLVSYRSECWFHAGRKLSGTGDGGASLPVGHRACRYADWLLYRTGGAGGLCADKAGRGDYFGSGVCGCDGNESVHRCGRIAWTCDDSCADRYFDSLVHYSGVCHCAAWLFLRT